MQGSFHFVDVGAANFSLSSGWTRSALANDLIVHLFEADPLAEEKLRSLSVGVGVEINVHRGALASSERTVRLNICKKREVSSVLMPNRKILNRFPNSERFDVEEVLEINTLMMDSVLVGIPVDFIKLDVQGFELDVLKGATSTLSGVLGLEIEVEFQEMYLGQPLFGEIDEFLRKMGFELFDFSSIYRYDLYEYPKPRGQALAADAVYLSRTIPKRFDGLYSDYLAQAKTIADGLELPEVFDFFARNIPSGRAASQY